MAQSHGVEFVKGEYVWSACRPCNLLTTDGEGHKERAHHARGEDAEDAFKPVTVRLLLPTGDTVTQEFQLSDTVASVIATHSAYIRDRIGDLGPEEEFVIQSEEDVLLPGQLCAPLSSLKWWMWSGDAEIHLEYRLRPSNLQIELEEDKDLDEHESIVTRLTRVDGVSGEDLINIAKMMTQDRNNNERSSDPVLEELLLASKHPANPFHYREFPFDVNTNTYAKMIGFVKERMPRTYGWVINLREGKHQLDSKHVIAAVQLIGQMMIMVSPTNSALAATKSVVLKSGGLTNSALDATQRSLYCQTSSSYRKTRQKLASVADSLAQKAASVFGAIPSFVIDNLNLKFQWFSHDLTQCILMYKDVDTRGKFRFHFHDLLPNRRS